jgi:hypothetical protein
VSDVAVRLVVVAVIVLVALAVAFIIGRVMRPPHPRVVVGDVGDRPGVVVFTATTCSTCKAAIAHLEDLGVPFREVTDELEQGQFDAWGVVAVPVTVVVAADDTVVATFSGVPRARALLAAVRRAGVPLGS